MNTKDKENLNNIEIKLHGFKNCTTKKRKLSQKNSPKTANVTTATLIEYLIKRSECSAIAHPQQLPVDAFLAGLAPTLKNLSPRKSIAAQKYKLNVPTS